MRPALHRLLVVVALVAVLGTACGDDEGAEGPGDEAASDLSGEITVSAAASLTDAFTEIGEDFEEANRGITVTFTFDSSGTLVDQIVEGAPVDVFASADEADMATLTDEGLVDGEPTPFARNELVIVTKPGNPEGIASLEDLVDAGVVALCAEDAPCGRFAGEVLDGSGVAISEESVTRGQNVRATLTAVTEGDAVAGIVYVTDAESAGDTVEAVEIPDDQNAVAVYPIGVLADAGNPEVAEAFAAYVASDEGQAELEEHGFLPAA